MNSDNRDIDIGELLAEAEGVGETTPFLDRWVKIQEYIDHVSCETHHDPVIYRFVRRLTDDYDPRDTVMESGDHLTRAISDTLPDRVFGHPKGSTDTYHIEIHGDTIAYIDISSTELSFYVEEGHTYETVNEGEVTPGRHMNSEESYDKWPCIKIEGGLVTAPDHATVTTLRQLVTYEEARTAVTVNPDDAEQILADFSVEELEEFTQYSDEEAFIEHRFPDQYEEMRRNRFTDFDDNTVSNDGGKS